MKKLFLILSLVAFGVITQTETRFYKPKNKNKKGIINPVYKPKNQSKRRVIDPVNKKGKSGYKTKKDNRKIVEPIF